jgi:hypothetical protein
MTARSLEMSYLSEGFKGRAISTVTYSLVSSALVLRSLKKRHLPQSRVESRPWPMRPFAALPPRPMRDYGVLDDGPEFGNVIFVGGFQRKSHQHGDILVGSGPMLWMMNSNSLWSPTSPRVTKATINFDLPSNLFSTRLDSLRGGMSAALSVARRYF